jgi:predicted RecA/RadA family phage recombinase
MTAEAVLTKDCDVIDLTTPSAGYASGEIVQLNDGRAGVILGLRALGSGESAAAQTQGLFRVLKTASVVVLPGGRVFWDRSAGTATPLQAEAGADFFLGTCHEGAASADTTLVVDLNVKPAYLVDLLRDMGDTAVVLTAGTPFIGNRGGGMDMGFSLTAEAQKLDWLSCKSFPVTIPAILEAVFQLITTCDAAVGVLAIGLANGTHATDVGTITESALFSCNLGTDLNLDCQCDDGTAAEVAETDSEVDLVAGTPVEVWIDARDLTDLKYYVNGVRVLAATAFDIGDATGPLKALAHLVKTANDSPGEAIVSHLAIRTTDIAA